MSNPEYFSEVFQHGSAWVRADFHMHSLADKEFSYAGNAASFSSDYVAALKAAGVRVAVITNHNKFDWEEFKTLAKAAKKEDIFLLPGLELSVKDGSNGIHMLVVFSNDWISNKETTDHVKTFLSVTFAGQANFENENGRSNHDLNETIRELDKFGRDYFWVCAHVEAKNGLWGGLGGGRIGELGKSELFRQRCLGFQKVRTNDTRVQVKAWLQDWYPAELEGCDCKSISDIGKGRHVYIKIGAFTFESVKFALLDKTNRVAAELPKQDHSYVKRVRFEGDKLDGRIINLSPELNTFIGIRGSGKSTILEALRYALDIAFGKNAADREYKEGSVKNALGSGGKVTLTAIDRHGHEYEVRRIVGEQPDVYVGGNLQPGINIRETVLHKPIYFGQKDLSNTGQGFENDLVEKLVGEKLVDVRHAMAEQRQAVVEIIHRLQKLSDVGDKQKEYEAKKQDAEFRLKTFKAHGVEEKLQKQVEFERDGRTTKDLSDFVTGYVQDLEEFIARYADDFASRRKYASKQNAAFFAEVFGIFDRIAKGFAEIGKVAVLAKAASIEMRVKVNEFDGLKNALKEEFAEIARKLSEELKSSGVTAIDPNEFLKLRKTIENAAQFLVALAKEKEQQLALRTQLSSALTALNDQWHQEFKLIKQQLDLINEQETALQIELDYKGDKAAFLRYMKDIFRGSKLRETTLDELVKAFADGAGLYRELDKAKAMVGGSAATFDEYFQQNLSALLTWQVPNGYTIKYHGKQLRNHSLGQRASALILFVLSQRDNDVVIIDQPEDDLDNQTIYEDVIKLVRKLKPKTQFVFATHNPNIPVLGDAEQIIACAYGNDVIETKVGSIDSPELQEAIVSIMEGGSEAFQRRKEIYQIWKRQNS
ncbi:MAG: AAA family ATPase [Deltaproteobacteria bacterium]|nr:AAA family ATPase [Deltaproteobacteria bacterium]